MPEPAQSRKFTRFAVTRVIADRRFGPLPPLHSSDEHGTMSAMARYMKKQVVVEAERWFKHGDHPAVIADPDDDSIGYVDTPEGRLKVEPGDWVITGIAGENYPCKSDVFGRLYKPVD